jgi:hypothetical protein
MTAEPRRSTKRVGRERPNGCGATENCKEIPPPHAKPRTVARQRLVPPMVDLLCSVGRAGIALYVG